MLGKMRQVSPESAPELVWSLQAHERVRVLRGGDGGRRDNADSGIRCSPCGRSGTVARIRRRVYFSEVTLLACCRGNAPCAQPLLTGHSAVIREIPQMLRGLRTVKREGESEKLTPYAREGRFTSSTYVQREMAEGCR